MIEESVGLVRGGGVRWFVVVWAVLAVMLSGCGAGGSTTLPFDEENYSHPSGIFSIPIPAGWVVEAEEGEQVVWLYAPEGGGDISVVMIAETLPGETEEEMSQAAQALLEGYMWDVLLDEDYEIYNSAETRVARNPALILDIARPLAEGYHVGRMVLVYLPGHLVFLAGFGPRSDWETFLPTFREMVAGMTFTVQPLPFAE